MCNESKPFQKLAQEPCLKVRLNPSKIYPYGYEWYAFDVREIILGWLRIINRRVPYSSINAYWQEEPKRFVLVYKPYNGEHIYCDSFTSKQEANLRASFLAQVQQIRPFCVVDTSLMRVSIIYK